MTNPTNPGWYDDPDAPDQLRYFDGILWTAHTTPRAGAPRVEAVRAEPALGDPAAAQAPAGPSMPPGTNPYQAPPAWRSRPPSVLGHAARAVGPTTSDGVPLASYGQRVGAFFIDGLIKTALNLVFGGWAAYLALRPFIDRLSTAVQTGNSVPLNASTPSADPRWMAVYLLISSLVGLAYSVYFLTRTGATPGKKVVGISVRRAAHAGPIDVTTATLRYAIPFASNVLTLVPVVGTAAFFLWCADHAFPLAQPGRRALHDLIAKTQVVIGSQPPRRR